MWATSLLVFSQEHHERQRHRQIGLVGWKLTGVSVYPVIIIARDLKRRGELHVHPLTRSGPSEHFTSSTVIGT
jgi:hypothetical protein